MAVLTTSIELAAVIFVIWGYFNEDKFIAFENRIAEYFRNK